MVLREIQQGLMSCIFSGQDTDKRLMEMIESPISSQAVAPLKIYRDSILSGLIHALKETYPVCFQLVGESFFTAMARQYAMLTPSINPDLNEYGRTFSEFISCYQPADSVPYLADVARLEWLCNLSMTASNEQSGNLHLLAGLAEQDAMHVVFLMPPSSYVLSSSYPVGDIWRIHQDRCGACDLSDIAEQAAYQYLVWRPQYGVVVVDLEDAKYYFIERLLEKNTLAKVCDDCLSRYPDVDMNNLIEGCLQNGWIQGFYLQDTG